MLKHLKNVYVVLAREVSTDANDGMVSIIKMIDKFTLQYNPAQLSNDGKILGKDPILFGGIKYVIATAWSLGQKLKKDTTFSFKVRMIDPDGRDLGGPIQSHTMPTGFDKVNFNFEIDGIPVTGPGHYKLLVELVSQSEELLAQGEYPFQVELIEGSVPLNK